MFCAYIIITLIAPLVFSKTPEEWQEIIKNCKEED